MAPPQVSAEGMSTNGARRRKRSRSLRIQKAERVAAARHHRAQDKSTAARCCLASSPSPSWHKRQATQQKRKTIKQEARHASNTPLRLEPTRATPTPAAAFSPVPFGLFSPRWAVGRRRSPAHGVVAGDGVVVPAAPRRRRRLLLRPRPRPRLGPRALQDRQRHRIHEHGRHHPQHLRPGGRHRRRRRPRRRALPRRDGGRGAPDVGGGVEGDLRRRGALRARPPSSPSRLRRRRGGDDTGGLPRQGFRRPGGRRGGRGDHGAGLPRGRRGGGRREGEEEAGAGGSRGPRRHAAAEAHDQEPRVRGQVQGQETGVRRGARIAGYTARGGASRTVKGTGGATPKET